MADASTLKNIQLIKSDTFIDVASLHNGLINYNSNNPTTKLMHAMEESYFFAENLDYYLADSIQFLFPFSHLDIYGPSGKDHSNTDPAKQDNKNDFQKQNIKDFILTDTFLARGWVNVGGQTVPFLKLSYLGGPDSKLAELTNNKMDSYIYLWLKVQNKSVSEYLKVPYNEETNRYEVELWGFKGAVNNHLSSKGKLALSNGNLQIRNDIITGSLNDFEREELRR